MTTKPPILYGAALLATLSLIWSGYALTDLMDSGRFGLSVAVAGDIGWMTVLWAEYTGVTIADRRWPAPAAGWLIAAGVAALLIIHGAEASRAQAVAGPFVVLVGKLVWTFALAAMRDPAALTPEQEAAIHTLVRDSEYATRLRAAERSRIQQEADAEIDRIRAEARTVLARDEADFEISLERLDKQAELHRRAPLALPPSPRYSSGPECAPAEFDKAAEQAISVAQEADPDTADEGHPDTSGQPDEPSGRDEPPPAAEPLSSPDTRPDSPDPLSVIAAAASGPADLVRSLAANGVPKHRLVSEAIRLRPDMVADSIRRTAKRLGEGPYL